VAATHKRATVERALTAKGFRPRKGDHRYFVYYTREGKKTAVRTKTSHGRGGADIPNNLFSRMARQCNLDTEQFRALVDCSLSQPGYEALLNEQDEI